jgi:hypothetical protein
MRSTRATQSVDGRSSVLFTQVCSARPVYADHLVENLGHTGNRLVESSRLPNEVGVEGAEDHCVVRRRAASMQLNQVAAIVGQQDTAFGNSECKNLRVWHGRVCSSFINLRASSEVSTAPLIMPKIMAQAPEFRNNRQSDVFVGIEPGH